MTKRRCLPVVITTLILMCTFLSGCSEIDHESKDIKDEGEDSEEVEYEAVNPLILIKKEKIEGTSSKQYIFYDPETNVMYSHVTDINHYGMIEMHNSDGTPRVYDGISDVQTLVFISKSKIEDAGISQYVYFDPETLVMYVHYTDINDKSLSEMHNSDGSLRTYTPKK